MPMLARYLLVSMFNIAAHQSVLFVLNKVMGWPGGWANACAALLVSIPAYFLSRNWVWEVDGDHDLRSQVVPFWIITIVGLVVSTAFAAAAEGAFGNGLPVNIASLFGYFVVWVGKFFLLDRLFASSDEPDSLKETV